VDQPLADGGNAIFLVEEPADVATLEVNYPSLAYVTQTTLSVDDTQAVIDALRALPGHRGPAERRHLLRHAEPPGRGQGAGAARDVVLVVGSPTVPTPTACASWPSATGSRPT
jgi:4-hydroxy-3-methylbut-2-en-1-yl diphosphate reductase